MESKSRGGLNVSAARLWCRWVACALLAGVCSAGPGARAGTLVIDDFSKPDPWQFFALAAGNSPSQEFTQLSSGAIGGQRDTLIHVEGLASPTAANGLIGFNTAEETNVLMVGTNGLSPAMAYLQYSGTNSANTATHLVNAHGLGAGLGIDLTQGGTNNQFLLQFLSSDAQPSQGLDVTITITSPGNKSSIVSTHVQNLLSSFSAYVPFSGLVGNASTSQVDSITFAFNSVDKVPNVDFEVTKLLAVPEPSSAVLLITAVGMLGWRSRATRRRRPDTSLPRERHDGR